MKKIYSLFVALSIVLCAMANSPYFLQKQVSLEETTKAVKLNKQESRQAKVEARQAKTVAPMAINGVRQMESVQTIAKQAIPANAARKAPAKAAAEATDTVKIVATTWAWKYYESDNDWYTTLIDATETYEIKLDYVSDTQAGTFTEDNCIMDYTGLYIYDEEGSRTIVTFTEVDIVVTDDENGLTLHAELLSTDNVLYIVDAHIAPLPEPKATVNLAYANAELLDATVTSSAFQFSALENNYYTSIFIYSDQIVGEYTTMDMYDPYYNYIAHLTATDTTFIDFLDLNAVVTKEGKTYNLVADVLGSDTILYHITMSYTKPDPTDTIDIVATDLFIDEFEFWFWGMTFTSATASNDDYEVAFELSIPLVAGEYTTEDFDAAYCAILRTSDETEIAMTEITATVTGEGKGRAIKAAVVGDDNILYNMDLSYVIPEATDTVNIVFDQVAVAEYYASYGDYYIYNANENYIVTLDIFAEKGELVGEFAGEDFDLYYTQLGVIANGDTTLVTIADAKAVVSAAEEGIALIEAELHGMDAVLYKVSTKVDVADKGLQYDATEGFLMDSYTTEDNYIINDQSENGYIMFDVEAADGSDLMGLVFWVDEADEKTIIPVGTYEINATTESGTVLASTGMGSQGLTYSLYATMEEGNIVAPCWFMVGGKVVVSEKDGILKIEVDAVNSNNLVIYVTCEYDLNTKQGLQYDMTEGSLNVTYTDNDDVVVETKYLAEDGVIYLDMTAADGSHTTSVAFFVEAADPTITIPAGTYPINDTQDYGTVMSSPGVQGGYIYPSFYGNLNAQGQILVPCYFMVGGNVVVENVEDHLKVTINALNSYDVPATIVYEASATAVENIVTGDNINTSKVVENNQLFIIKEGVKYNVLGTVVK